MTPEELLKEHAMGFTKHLVENYEHMGYQDQKIKNGPWIKMKMDRWRDKSNYSIEHTTDWIYDHWVPEQVVADTEIEQQ